MSMIHPARLRGVRTNKSDCRFPAGRDDRCEVVRRSQIYTSKLATFKFWDSVKGAYHRSLRISLKIVANVLVLVGS